MKKKKLIGLCVAIVLALLLLAYGIFAFLSDTANQQVTSTAGNVSIRVPSIALSNANNLNPGDNDPTNSATVRKGTDHNFTFTVSNNGNKSIVTRNVLDIKYPYTKGTNSNGYNLVSTVFNKDDCFLLYSDKSEELKEKYYIVLDASNNEVIVKTLDNNNKNSVIGIRYVLTGASLNGTGSNAETETGITATSANYTYKFGMKKEVSADNTENKNIEVKLNVEAMQYRNSGDADWSVLFTKTIPTSVK